MSTLKSKEKRKCNYSQNSATHELIGKSNNEFLRS